MKEFSEKQNLRNNLFENSYFVKTERELFSEKGSLCKRNPF